MIITGKPSSSRCVSAGRSFCDFGFTIAIGRSLLSFNAGETQVKQRQRADQQEDQRGDGGRRAEILSTAAFKGDAPYSSPANRYSPPA